MTVSNTRWRFDNYTKSEFYIAKTHEKVRETLFTFKLHSCRRPFILTRLSHYKIENTNFKILEKKSFKNS